MSNQYVYVVQHVRERPKGEQSVKFIGVYTSESEANRTVVRLRTVKGFREHPDGFHVDKYELNKDHWTEGFGVL